MSGHDTNETLRKAIHIAAGFGALALKFLTWEGAAAIALVATLSNWLLLHRVVGRRVARHERGWDAGIVLYPLMVLLLILLFRHQLAVPAICWAIIAFGDGFAGLIGRAIPISRVPWNNDKSVGGLLAFAIFGGLAAAGVAMCFGFPWRTPVAAALIAAIVETLPLRVDDNITVPFAAATTLAICATPTVPFHHPPTPSWFLLLMNVLLAAGAYAAASVDASGLIAGIVLGTIVIAGGPSLYAALLTFFLIGTAATKLGFRRKAAAGLAQEKGGRRGATHAIANVGVAALCAIAVWRGLSILPLLMGIASLATAACDTTGSEIGQLFGRRAFLATTFRRVEPGTEGALSIEGTVAGILAALVVSIVGVAALVHHIHRGFIGNVVLDKSRAVVTLTVCAFLGSYAESLAGNWNRRHGSRVPNGVLNFFNTVMGALLFFTAAQFVPVYGFEF